MSIVLAKQVEAAREAGEELEEEVLRNHGRVMLCRDIEDLASICVRVLSEVNEHVERWQDELSAVDDAAPERAEIAALESNWETLYKSHWENFVMTAKLITSMEKFGYVVDGKEAFLSAYRGFSHIVSFSLEQIGRGVAQIRSGDSHSLGAVTRELWDNPLH